MGGVWVKFFWNNPLVEKEDFIQEMVDFYCILYIFVPLTNSDIRLLMVNSDWLITQHSILVDRCFIGAVGNSFERSIRESFSLPLSLCCTVPQTGTHLYTSVRERK